MCPIVPAELTQNAVQMVVYFVSALGALFGLALSSRW
jgi:hypothetical protein